MTIAALATAPQRSAIGVIRISGNGAKDVIKCVFRPKYGKISVRRLTLGYLLSASGERLDEVLCAVFEAPNSYTGEDMAELYCHGSPGVLEGALRSIFAVGARQALPGEFTKRAFLNGKLDLSQAEAVIELIDSESEAEAVNAAKHLGGTFGQKIKSIRGELISLEAHFFALIDYPDEDIPEFSGSEAEKILDRAEKELDDLCRTFQRGSLLREGIPCAIAGSVNAGKSSLLNALSGFERSIVTDIPGTTRDIVEQRIRIGGALLNLRDTAGLRDSKDRVESIGIDRARKAIDESEIILLVFDGSREFESDDEALISKYSGNNKVICVINKQDIEVIIDKDRIKSLFDTVLELSAVTGEGLQELIDEIGRRIKPEKSDEALVTNPRYIECMTRALECIKRAKDSCIRGVGFDGVTLDVEEAARILGEITGEETSAQIVENIFARFCVGK